MRGLAFVILLAGGGVATGDWECRLGDPPLLVTSSSRPRCVWGWSNLFEETRRLGRRDDRPILPQERPHPRHGIVLGTTTHHGAAEPPTHPLGPLQYARRLRRTGRRLEVAPRRRQSRAPVYDLRTLPSSRNSVLVIAYGSESRSAQYPVAGTTFDCQAHLLVHLLTCLRSS